MMFQGWLTFVNICFQRCSFSHCHRFWHWSRISGIETVSRGKWLFICAFFCTFGCPFCKLNLQFISSNGGTRNAATGGSYQDYWFSIKPSLLSQALPRLAAFFHSPLFYTNLTSREIHAVDSENKRNLQNDARRIFQLGKSLSLPGHRWGKFGTGNYASLTEAARKKIEEGSVSNTNNLLKDDADDEKVGPVERETRRRLVEWWEQEYCAGRMTLAVVGKGSSEFYDDGDLFMNARNIRATRWTNWTYGPSLLFYPQ